MGLQFTVVDAPDLTLPEDKIFRARLVEMKVHTFMWTDHKVSPPEQKEGEVLQWWWEVQSQDEYNGRRVKGETDAKISNHPRNRFRLWGESLLGRELPMGMNLDTDDLVGLAADITIRHKPDKKDPAKKYEEVDEVMPATGGQQNDGWNSPPPF